MMAIASMLMPTPIPAFALVLRPGLGDDAGELFSRGRVGVLAAVGTVNVAVADHSLLYRFASEGT